MILFGALRALFSKPNNNNKIYKNGGMYIYVNGFEKMCSFCPMSPTTTTYDLREERRSMFLKELYKAAGMELEVHNLLADYKLKDGTDAHIVKQAISNGIDVNYKMLISFVKDYLPSGSRLCCIFEIMGDYELKELEQLAVSPLSILAKRRCIYLDKEMLAECAKEVRRK